MQHTDSTSHQADRNAPRKSRPPKLGERRTVVEVVPDHRPIVDESIYTMAHQVCVPGGWETVASQQLRGPEGQAGVYGPVGQMMEVSALRRSARQLAEQAGKKLARHPYTRLNELVTKVDLQEGEQGQPGSWDDPGVAMEICKILRDGNII
ncbi:hypothetical protein ABZ517_05785 [Streptomyces scabiei]|uniref:hypothetical protein n=1 Tax=Streptomyces scabiei TaxID=1930 RepID=UPI0034000D85